MPEDPTYGMSPGAAAAYDEANPSNMVHIVIRTTEKLVYYPSLTPMGSEVTVPISAALYQDLLETEANWHSAQEQLREASYIYFRAVQCRICELSRSDDRHGDPESFFADRNITPVAAYLRPFHTYEAVGVKAAEKERYGET